MSPSRQIPSLEYEFEDTALTNTSVGVSYTGKWMQNVETTGDTNETEEVQLKM